MTDANGKVLLELNDVGLSYKTSTGCIEALKSVNTCIREHEFVCVLGPSGCGKSSLLGLISGLEKPTNGSVRLDGREIIGVDSRCGIVFQRDNRTRLKRLSSYACSEAESMGPGDRYSVGCE